MDDTSKNVAPGDIPDSNSQRLLNEHEAAEYLRLAVATLRRWRWAGRGPVFHKIGAAVRYRLSDLYAFIKAGRRTSTTDTGQAT